MSILHVTMPHAKVEATNRTNKRDEYIMDWNTVTERCERQHISSCIVEQNNKIIFHYEQEPRASSHLMPINSCTKSIVSTLYCIGLYEQLLPSPDELISPWFPEFERAGNKDATDITVEHLLTLTAGFEWNEFGGRNDFPKMTRTDDWIQYVAKLPIINKPGTSWCYNSGISQLLAELIVRVSGVSLAQMAEQHLFTPLHIQDYEWKQAPSGTHTGGFGMQLTAMDMLKFGQLWLADGIWDEIKLFQAEDCRKATSPYIEVKAPERGYYGWQWWCDQGRCNQEGTIVDIPYYYARGYGGQFIVNIPSLKSVVVLTRNQRHKQQSPLELFREEILPLLTL